MADPNRPRTVMETDEEIRAALLESNTSGIVSRIRPTKPSPEPTADNDAPTESSSARAFRPSSRPPTPILVVCDDGSTDGEFIRLRAEKFVVGRTTGDFLLPHDALVSARHLEIVRVLSDGRWKWLIADLKSTHGAYFRFTSHQLVDQTEFLLGRSRFRFEQPNPPPQPSVQQQTDSTIGWSAPQVATTPPRLIEIARTGTNRKVDLADECWIGSDPSCTFHVVDDPFLEPRHARVHRHPKRGWIVENNKSQNGVWVRRDQLVFDPAKDSQGNSIRFQIGEQQFKLVVQP
jgi:pSer/pThr/pTyr-binding forkhead associated (FHA) protein